jgi:hypothetical protein
MKLNTPSALALVALFGAATLLHADTCTFGGPLVVGSLNTETCDTGTQSTTLSSTFSLSQFNPDLGTLQDTLFAAPQISYPVAAIFTLNVYTLSGDGSITLNVPSGGCPFGCGSYWDVYTSVTAESSSGITVTTDGAAILEFTGLGLPNPPPGDYTLPVSWEIAGIVTGIPTTNFPPGLIGARAESPAPWLGTGTVAFDLTGSVTNVAFLNYAAITGITYDANVVYSFVYEPTPEPSLLLVTGALLGMIAVRKMVGRRN